MVRHVSATMKPKKPAQPATSEPAKQESHLSAAEKELEDMKNQFSHLSLEDLQSLHSNLDSELEKEIQQLRAVYEKRKKAISMALDAKKK